MFQAIGSKGQTLGECVLTIYVIVRPNSSTSQQNTEQASLSSRKDIIIIVLAVVATLLHYVILVYAVYRVRVHKKNSEDNVMSYEGVNRNNVQTENVYATIQN